MKIFPSLILSFYCP